MNCALHGSSPDTPRREEPRMSEPMAREDAGRIEYSDGRVESGRAEPNRVDAGAADFTANNRTNIWDSINTNEAEDDLDVPPTLRDRLRGKNRD